MSAEVLRQAADALDGHLRLILVDRHRDVQGPSGRVLREALAAWLRQIASTVEIDEQDGSAGEPDCKCPWCDQLPHALTVARTLTPP